MTREQIESELKQLADMKQQIIQEFEQVKQQLFAKFEADKEQLVANVNSRVGQVEGQALIYQKWITQIESEAPTSVNGQKDKAHA